MKAYIATGCGIRKVTHDHLRNCDSSVYTRGNGPRGKVYVKDRRKMSVLYGTAVRCEIIQGNKHADTQHCNISKLIRLCCTLFLYSTLHETNPVLPCLVTQRTICSISHRTEFSSYQAVKKMIIRK